jgi:hypothetical protein
MILAWRWQWTRSGQSYVSQPCLNPLSTFTTPQTTTSKSRLTFIHNPTVLVTPAQSALSRFVAHLIYKGLLSEATSASLLQALGGGEVVDDSPSRDAVIRKLAGDIEPAEYEALVYDDYVKSTRHIAREFGVQPGQSALVVNGRVRVFALHWTYALLMLACCGSLLVHLRREIHSMQLISTLWRNTS